MGNRYRKLFDTSNIVVSDDMIDYDFSNDPEVKAKTQRAKEFLEKHPFPEDCKEEKTDVTYPAH